MTPIGQRRRAAIELVQRSNQRGDVQVLWLENRRQSCVHLAKILEQCPVRSQPAQCCLPGMHMRIHQPRNDDVATPINHLRVIHMDARRNLRERLSRDGSDGRVG